MESKADRLKAFSRKLQQEPVERAVTATQWNAWTTEAGLTPDDLSQIETLALSHRGRARQAFVKQQWDDFVEEAVLAIVLDPLNKVFVREVQSWIGPKAFPHEGVEQLRHGLTLRVGRSRQRPGIPWIPLFVAVILFVPLTIFWSLSGPGLQVQLPHAILKEETKTLDLSLDTQGVPFKLSVSESRLRSFPEAFVVEVSAWVVFPQHAIHSWSGQWQVLDSAGNLVASQASELINKGQADLPAGQGLQLFQQLDAAQWHDKAFSVLLKTTRIQAQASDSATGHEIPLEGSQALPQGYQLQVKLLNSVWEEKFSAHVHQADLELKNTGLTPFQEVSLELQWRSPSGELLKTLQLRPVSAARTPLAPGTGVGVHQETVFDAEVFSWNPGEEPHPVLVLRSWK